MLVTVRLFAILRERAGRATLELEVADGSSVAEVLAAAAREPGLGEVLARMPLRAALNREYVDDATPVAAGDELALIPPVSGGATDAAGARVTEEPLEVARLAEAVGRPGAGAIVVFCGTTREVDKLEYEAYAEMATERIEAVLADCVAAHGLEAAAAEHRVGSVPLGEPSVVIAVAAAHRGEAFAGAREAIEPINAEAPIWKREVEGEEKRWVEGAVPPPGPVGSGREVEQPAGIASPLTHVDGVGNARMVDVGAKPETQRRARAEATVRMSPDTAAAVARGNAPKGDVLGTARIAGIGAAKRTWELIPLCHPLALDFVDVDCRIDEAAGSVAISADAGTTGKTGVEMEAMTACAVAALTVYDMVKGLERGVTIESLGLTHKSGGRSGEWTRP